MPVQTAKKKTRKTKAKLPSIRGLRDRAWVAFSRSVRMRASDWRWYAKCYTCGIYADYKQLQAGHFLHSQLDFDRRNVHPQCVKCNHYQNGNLAKYATRLVKEYGPMVLKDLEIASGHRGNKYSRKELEEILTECKSES